MVAGMSLEPRGGAGSQAGAGSRAGAAPLAEVDALEIAFRGRTVVTGMSLTVSPGEVVALVGESGSGKSVTARSLVGLVGPGSRVRAARLQVAGQDVLRLRERGLRRLRGGTVGLIAQDAFASLDPLRPVGREVADALRLHTRLSADERRTRVVELLARAGIPAPELRAGQYPHELSGGLRQRALIAAAIAAEPRLLIADEPTTALDATVQAGILDLLAGLARDGTGVLLISHDLAVVSRLADRVIVMRAGSPVETGPTAEVIRNPRHDYTRALVAAVPTGRPRGDRLSGAGRIAVPVGEPPSAVAAVPPVLTASGLSVAFPVGGGRRLRALDDVSLAVMPGRSLGIVGESGSGKTTLARVLLGLQRPDAGTVELEGMRWQPAREGERRPRRSLIATIPQDSFDTLDPRWTIERTLRDALGRGAGAADLAELLERVGLPQTIVARRPRNLSPGQRQRVVIARALAGRPRVLIADEPVSSLDVSIQAQILDLLDELQAELGLAIVLISHDLGVIGHSTDELIVLRAGAVVESGPTAEVLTRPTADYTRELAAAALRIG